MKGALGGLAPVWRNSTIPWRDAITVAAVSTAAASTAPAVPKMKAWEGSETGIGPLPRSASTNTLPSAREMARARTGPSTIAGAARSAPSTSAKRPSCGVVTPLLFSITVSRALDLTASPDISAR